MATESVFWSDHPDVLAWWKHATESLAAFNERCKTIEEHFPGFRSVINERTRTKYLVGIVGYDETAPLKPLLPPPSDAWRRVDRNGFRHYVPYKNHRKDQTVIDLFTGVSWKMERAPGGLPMGLIVDGRWNSPGLRILDGVVWADYACGAGYVEPDPELESKRQLFDASADRLDMTVWTRAKLSEFYAARGD